MKICEDGLGITMRVTTLKITFYVFPSSSGGYFGVFLVPFWDMIFCLSMIIFNITSSNYVEMFTSFMTLFNGWGLNVSKLQSHYEETVYFLLPHPKISCSQYYLDGLNITLTVTT